MSGPTSVAGAWPDEPLAALLLVLVLLLLVFEGLGRTSTGRLGLAGSPIRLARPTLVPLADADRAVAAGLLGGIVADALRRTDAEPTQ